MEIYKATGRENEWERKRKSNCVGLTKSVRLPFTRMFDLIKLGRVPATRFELSIFGHAGVLFPLFTFPLSSPVGHAGIHRACHSNAIDCLRICMFNGRMGGSEY